MTILRVFWAFVLAHPELFIPPASAFAAAVVGLIVSPLRDAANARARALYGVIVQLVPNIADRGKLTSDIETVFTGVPRGRLALMPTRTVALVTESSRLSFSDLAKIAAAIKSQLASHVAPAWGRAPWNVIAVVNRKSAPAGAIVIVAVENDPSVPDALGWHTEDSTGRVFGEIALAPILDNGGKALTGPYSVASVFSHEVIETFLDASVSTWDQGPDGSLYAHEGCDAVEGDGYAIAGVMVSNFVLPPFFDPQAPQGSRFDYQGKLTAPFQTAPGGYQVLMSAGLDANGQATLVTNQVFGEKVPVHIQASRKGSRRVMVRTTSRRSTNPERLALCRLPKLSFCVVSTMRS